MNPAHRPIQRSIGIRKLYHVLRRQNKGVEGKMSKSFDDLLSKVSECSIKKVAVAVAQTVPYWKR